MSRRCWFGVCCLLLNSRSQLHRCHFKYDLVFFRIVLNKVVVRQTQLLTIQIAHLCNAFLVNLADQIKELMRAVLLWLGFDLSLEYAVHYLRLQLAFLLLVLHLWQIKFKLVHFCLRFVISALYVIVRPLNYKVAVFLLRD